MIKKDSSNSRALKRLKRRQSHSLSIADEIGVLRRWNCKFQILCNRAELRNGGGPENRMISPFCNLIRKVGRCDRIVAKQIGLRTDCKKWQF